jgi:hypothetical protein
MLSAEYAQRIHRLSTWDLVEEMVLLGRDLRVARAAHLPGDVGEILDRMGMVEREAQRRQLTIDDVIEAGAELGDGQ